MLNNKKVLPYLLLAGQFICMLSVIPMAMVGNAWQWAITIAVYCIFMLGVTVGYHRLVAHRAFKCPKWLRSFFMISAGLPFYGPALVWVANHREHHRYADTDRDPHSPYYRGVLTAYFLQVLAPIKFRYVKDLLRDDSSRFQVAHYWHFIFGYIALLAIIDPFAVVYAYLAPAGLSKIIGGLVFTYSHRNRKANSDTWVGLITLGEGFHESHHVNARTHRWHKFDIGGILIEAIDRDKITQKT